MDGCWGEEEGVDGETGGGQESMILRLEKKEGRAGRHQAELREKTQPFFGEAAEGPGLAALTWELCAESLKYAARSGSEKAAGEAASERSCNSLVVATVNDFGWGSPFPAGALRPTGRAW